MPLIHTVLQPRWLNLLGFAGCLAVMASVLWFQHVDGLEPCPLCILQRVWLMGCALVLLVAGAHNPARTGRRIYSVLTALLATGGGAVAARHLWLQNLPPDEVPDCGPGLDYMLDVFPLQEALRMVLTGSGECADVDWTFLGLSMPGWALLVFCGLFAFAVLQFFWPDTTSEKRSLIGK